MRGCGGKTGEKTEGQSEKREKSAIDHIKRLMKRGVFSGALFVL